MLPLLVLRNHWSLLNTHNKISKYIKYVSGGSIILQKQTKVLTWASGDFPGRQTISDREFFHSFYFAIEGPLHWYQFVRGCQLTVDCFNMCCSVLLIAQNISHDKPAEPLSIKKTIMSRSKRTIVNLRVLFPILQLRVEWTLNTDRIIKKEIK